MLAAWHDTRVTHCEQQRLAFKIYSVSGHFALQTVPEQSSFTIVPRDWNENYSNLTATMYSLPSRRVHNFKWQWKLTRSNSDRICCLHVIVLCVKNGSVESCLFCVKTRYNKILFNIMRETVWPQKPKRARLVKTYLDSGLKRVIFFL